MCSPGIVFSMARVKLSFCRYSCCMLLMVCLFIHSAAIAALCAIEHAPPVVCPCIFSHASTIHLGPHK